MIKHWLHSECLLAFRQPHQVYLSILFFLLIAVIFPMLMPYQQQSDGNIAAAIIWITITLSCLSSHGYLYAQDSESGVLTHIYLSQTPLGGYVIAKTAIYWLKFVLPLILATPLVGLGYQMSLTAIAWLTISLLLATPSLVLVCSLVSALLLGLRQQNMMLFLLILPLIIPELIFGTGVLQAWRAQESMADPIYLLLAVLILSLSLLPPATVAALKMNLNKRL